MTNTILTPNEKLTGSGDQCAQILGRLAQFRSDLRQALRLAEKYPHLTFSTLDKVIAGFGAEDLAVFEAGVQSAAERFAEFGVGGLLPLERVFVGTRSMEPAFGGFHYGLLTDRQADDTQNPGYRYVQAAAVITKYGDLHGAGIAAPGVVGLDLLRAYVHDCFHWATFRSFRLGVDGGIHRNQHGINFRRENGATYSARDMAGSALTRNLGVIMEGAFDREAMGSAARAAAVLGVTCPKDGVDRFAFLDAVGAPTVGDSPNSYTRTINAPYAAFLAEEAGADERDLHELIIRASLDGDLGPLQRWLDGRHGPGEYTALFRSNAYVPASAATYQFLG